MDSEDRSAWLRARLLKAWKMTTTTGSATSLRTRSSTQRSPATTCGTTLDCLSATAAQAQGAGRRRARRPVRAALVGNWTRSTACAAGAPASWAELQDGLAAVSLMASYQGIARPPTPSATPEPSTERAGLTQGSAEQKQMAANLFRCCSGDPATLPPGASQGRGAKPPSQPPKSEPSARATPRRLEASAPAIAQPSQA